MAQEAAATKPSKAKKHRSPAYPAIPLKTAIERARALYEKEKRHPAPMAVAAKHWGFSEKSSGGQSAVAALIHFGLLADAGTGKARTVKLTDLALRILLDQRPDSPEVMEAIKRAAMHPKIHAELFKKYGIPLPSDESIRTYLILDRSFNEAVVNDLIKEFKDTLTFAKILASDTVEDEDEGDDDTDPREEPPIEKDLPPSIKKNLQSPPGAKPEQGEEIERLRFNLKGGRRVRVFFSGRLPTQADINKLIANLELNKDTFPEDEEE